MQDERRQIFHRHECPASLNRCQRKVERQALPLFSNAKFPSAPEPSTAGGLMTAKVMSRFAPASPGRSRAAAFDIPSRPHSRTSAPQRGGPVASSAVHKNRADEDRLSGRRRLQRCAQGPRALADRSDNDLHRHFRIAYAHPAHRPSVTRQRKRQMVGPRNRSRPSPGPRVTIHDVCSDVCGRLRFGDQHDRPANREQIVEPAGHRHAGYVSAIGNQPDVCGRKERFKVAIFNPAD